MRIADQIVEGHVVEQIHPRQELHDRVEQLTVDRLDQGVHVRALHDLLDSLVHGVVGLPRLGQDPLHIGYLRRLRVKGVCNFMGEACRELIKEALRQQVLLQELAHLLPARRVRKHPREAFVLLAALGEQVDEAPDLAPPGQQVGAEALTGQRLQAPGLEGDGVGEIEDAGGRIVDHRLRSAHERIWTALRQRLGQTRSERPAVPAEAALALTGAEAHRGVAGAQSRSSQVLRLRAVLAGERGDRWAQHQIVGVQLGSVRHRDQSVHNRREARRRGRLDAEGPAGQGDQAHALLAGQRIGAGRIDDVRQALEGDQVSDVRSRPLARLRGARKA